MTRAYTGGGAVPVHTISTRPVGARFGRVGVILDRDGAEIARCATVRPFDCAVAALDDALALACRLGLHV